MIEPIPLMAPIEDKEQHSLADKSITIWSQRRRKLHTNSIITIHQFNAYSQEILVVQKVNWPAQKASRQNKDEISLKLILRSKSN